MLRKLILFLTILFLLLLHAKPSFAAENFDTEYNIIYTVSENGDTHVVMRVGLTNTTSDYYASAYKIQVGFQNIFNVKASDPGGDIKPDIQKVVEGNVIDVTFNSQVIGQGKTLPFTIYFDTPDIAKKQGNIWEINIPGITNQDDFTDFNVTVGVPESFGRPTYSKPEILGKNAVFTKEQLGRSGISIGYGEKQVYDFRLYYHLRNKNLFPIRTEIALPPSTNYQDVFIESISPKPLNVVKDDDGNWLAKFQLLPSEKVDIEVKGKAQLYLYPREERVDESTLDKYLEEQPYWQVSHNEIIRLARELKTPEAIYDYVVKTLTYDFKRVADNQSRLGAISTLKNPKSAVCLEFTDLFVALARAAGIPTREVNGFAYTQNARQRPLSLVKDILHAWPEYYDRERKMWIMVDPTWGNTTGGIDYFHRLDFDHFTFVRKGVDSEYPIPAGGYKLSGEDKKDVYIAFSDKPLNIEQKLSVIPLIAKQHIPFLPIRGKILVQNVSQNITTPSAVAISSGVLMPRDQIIKFGEIPPFGFVELPISFHGVPALTKTIGTFTIQIQDSSINQSIEVGPLVFLQQTITGKYRYVVLTFIIFITAYAAGRIFIFRRSK